MNILRQTIFGSLLCVSAIISTSFCATVPVMQTIQAEDFSAMHGATFDPPTDREPRLGVRNCGTGDWIRFDSIHFIEGAYDSVYVNCWTVWEKSSTERHWFVTGSKVTVRLDSPTGQILASLPLKATDPNMYKYDTSSTFKAAIAPVSGIHNLVLTFEGSDTVCIVDKTTLKGNATVNIAQARDYYVATNGDNGWAGTISNPFKTIQHAASIMKPGDRCFIRQGIYRETVKPVYTGLPGASLLFSAYNNEDVYISGADPVTGWTPANISGRPNIYKAPMKWSMGAYNDQLLVDGKMAVTARSPNINEAYVPWFDWDQMYPVGFFDWSRWKDTIDQMLIPTHVPFGNAGTAWPTETIRSGNIEISQSVAPHLLPAGLFNKPTDFYKGALFKLQNDWWSSDAIITGSSSPTASKALFNVTAMSSVRVNWGGGGWIHGALNLLDAPNEWLHIDSTAYLIAPDGSDPSGHLVEAKKRDIGFDGTGKQYINLTGIKFIATSATFEDAWYCTIDNCQFKYVSHYDAHEWWDNAAGYDKTPLDPSSGNRGVYLSGGYNTIQNSLIAISAACGVILDGTHQTVRNCRIRDIDYDVTYYAGIFINKRDFADKNAATGMSIIHNTIYNCARSTINFHASGDNSIPANRSFIQYNDLGRFGWLAPEVTSIGADGGLSMVDISRNWFHSGCGFSAWYIGADYRWGAKQWWIHHNVFFKGKPINEGSAVGMIGGNWTIAWEDTGRSGSLIFNNTFVDSGNPAQRGLETWPGGFQMNNLVAMGDTAPWKFNNPRNRDYTLKSNSPAVNAGTILPDWVSATTGVSSLYNGTKPDLGAYELGDQWVAGADWQEQNWMYPPLPLTTANNLPLSGFQLNTSKIRLHKKAISISFPKETACLIALYSASGRMVRTMPEEKRFTATISTATISSGTYFLKVTSGSQTLITKIGIVQ